MKRILKTGKALQADWARLFPVRSVRRILTVYFFLAVFAPLLSSHDPLAVRTGGTWNFPAFSQDRYFVNANGSRELKAGIDWRKRSEDFMLLSPVPYGPDETDPLNNRCVSPLSSQRMLSSNGQVQTLPLRYRHWLGTTFTGKDVLCLLIHGCRTSLLIGSLTMLLTGVIAFIFGGSAGWAGNHRWRIGRVRIPLDALHTAVTTAISGVPRFLLVLTLSAAAPRSIGTLVLILAITGWPELSRSVRTGLLQLRSAAFMEQAISAGATEFRILFRHAWPNLSALTLNLLLTVAAGAIMAESALTFLGAGLPPDNASWGQLLTESRRFPEAWWLSLFPVLALFGISFVLFRTNGYHNSR